MFWPSPFPHHAHFSPPQRRAREFSLHTDLQVGGIARAHKGIEPLVIGNGILIGETASPSGHHLLATAECLVLDGAHALQDARLLLVDELCNIDIIMSVAAVVGEEPMLQCQTGMDEWGISVGIACHGLRQRTLGVMTSGTATVVRGEPAMVHDTVVNGFHRA